MIIEIDNDKVLWSHGTNLIVEESWNRADIEELIKVYENQKHGRWTYDGKHWICTVCKEIAPCDRDGEYVFSPYCHHCGAIMDGWKNVSRCFRYSRVFNSLHH